MSKANEAVTVVVSRQVKMGMETRFEAVCEALTIAANEFEGHQGSLLLKPVTSIDPEYRIVFRFASQTDLDRWSQSTIRQELLAEMESLVTRESREMLDDGIATWFDFSSADMAPAKTPDKLRMTIVSWLALYPIVTAIFLFFDEPLATLSLPVRTFVVTVVVMFAMSYIAMPRFTKWFKGWLFK